MPVSYCYHQYLFSTHFPISLSLGRITNAISSSSTELLSGVFCLYAYAHIVHTNETCYGGFLFLCHLKALYILHLLFQIQPLRGDFFFFSVWTLLLAFTPPPQILNTMICTYWISVCLLCQPVSCLFPTSVTCFSCLY